MEETKLLPGLYSISTSRPWDKKWSLFEPPVFPNFSYKMNGNVFMNMHHEY